MANVNIELGYKTLIWFNANPTLVLLAGQIVYLGQTGTYKIGDGVSTLSALSFLGISSETQTLQNVTDLGNTTTNDIQFDTGVGVLLDNTSRLREGTIDAGYGGAKGIAQICAVGYELKWESGTLYVMDGNGTHIRHSLYNFASIPSATEDISKGFLVGTRWSLDNGDVYVCTDNTITAAVWVLEANDFTSAEKTKLSGIATGAEVNVNADWNATSGDAEILNKPTIGVGDMTKAVYDVDNTGIVDNAEAIIIVGRNATGSTLRKGTIIYILGSTGNRPNFVKAQANSEATSAGTFGVIVNDIANNTDGNCCVLGYLDTLDTRTTATYPFTTDTLADGDTIYLSPTTAGYITNVKPSAPNHLVYLGKVTRTSPTNGTIIYRIQNGYELEELHNVAIASVANNDILTYESSTSLWKNKTVVSALGFTPYDATNPSGYITSSALSTYVPYTGATANVDLGTRTLTTPTINGVSGLLSFKTTDNVSVGNYATPSAQRIFTVGQDTGFVSIGSVVGITSWGAIYLDAITPTTNNYALGGSGTFTSLNSSNIVQIGINNSARILVNHQNISFTPGSYAGGAIENFTFTKPNNTNQTLSTPIIGFNYNGGTRQWATGAITAQTENVWGATTYSFVGASTITNAYGNVFNAPIAGTNCTITNNWAAQFNGNVVIGSTGQLIEIKQTATAPTFIQTGATSSTFSLKSGTRTLEFLSVAGDQNYFSSTGANFRIRTTDVQNIQFYTNSTQRFTIGSDGNFYINEPGNFIFGTTTGTKIGAGTTQKLSFWNATPIVQPTTLVTASTFVTNTSGILNDTATFDGYTIGQIVKALRNIGLLA